MWIQKDKSTKAISWKQVLDCVVIDGVMWVEILEEVRNVCIAQC